MEERERRERECVCACVFGEGERRRREKYRVVKPKVDKWRKIDIWPFLSAEVAVWGVFLVIS